MVRISPTTKQVLLIAGAGAFIAGSLVFPGLPKILLGRRLESLGLDNFLNEDEWESFDEARLRQKLRALHNQKVIKIFMVGDKMAVQITKKGRRRLLKYKFEDLKIPKPNNWDKKWRIVAYDIPKEKKGARDAIRSTLKELGFLELQKSVYLFPYPCHEMIEFLREIYGVGEHVTYLTIGYLEEEDAYKRYFDL